MMSCNFASSHYCPSNTLPLEAFVMNIYLLHVTMKTRRFNFIGIMDTRIAKWNQYFLSCSSYIDKCLPSIWGKSSFQDLTLIYCICHLEPHQELYCSVNVINLTLCTAVAMNTAVGTSGTNDVIGLGVMHFIQKCQWKWALIVLIQSSHMIIIENH